MSQTDYAPHAAAYAAFFVAKGKDEDVLPFPDQLDAKKLDYSLDSLAAVDRYLEHLHLHAAEIDADAETNLVVWGGCYLGEVIRNTSRKHFRWMNHDVVARADPQFAAKVTFGPATMVLLVDDRGTVIMPLNKIGRFLHEGPANNLQDYAKGEQNYPFRPR